MGSDTPPWHCMCKWAYLTYPTFIRSIGEIVNDREKPKYEEKMYLSATFFWEAQQPPQWAKASSFMRFLDHNDAPQSVGILWRGDQLVAEIPARQHSQQSSMPPVGFKPTISAGEWPQTYALGCAATGTGSMPLWPP